MPTPTRRMLPLALAAALLLIAVPAQAGGWRHGRHGHGHHYGRHHGHHGHGHHGHGHHGHGHYGNRHHGHHHGYGHYYAPRYVEHHYYGYPVYHHPAPGFFLCGPCGHHFDSYDALYGHVHHHHHVPLVHLPGVIVHATLDATLGYIFHGY